MMQKHIRGDAAFARPFHAIRDIEFAPENIVTGASFTASSVPGLPPQPPLPLLQVALDRFIEILLQEGKP
ncbi:hypothetical protein [Pantoea dispersa]|uniref:Uncharacterized protein n=1 Tax=Pantoea dispersa TaxID=59814 RepID=A0A8E1RVF7_9GAMM|nr:hypothetical protein [Pantoea dispersa]KTR90489.1 hypothetical protein SA2_10985 [Pantoea dispersa]KTS22187.1 hypothetical protein SA4R_10995 [Pantoea dispersa]KTS60106.1 hypothetical protein SA5R_12805 [Pantoea dispersa]KTS65324.1 hypothetical protein SA3R_21090 [Pantoea dispersa]UXO70795.1 hypothetical protein N7977_19430 [Pantoea dispersa]